MQINKLLVKLSSNIIAGIEKGRGFIICHTIKKNESDVRNVDFELESNKDRKSSSFSLFLNF